MLEDMGICVQKRGALKQCFCSLCIFLGQRRHKIFCIFHIKRENDRKFDVAVRESGATMTINSSLIEIESFSVR